MNKFKYAPILLLVFSFGLVKDAVCQSNYDPTDEVINRHINNPTDTVLLLKRISDYQLDDLSKVCSNRFVKSPKFKRLKTLLLSSNLSLALMQEARLQTFFAGRNKVFIAFARQYDDNQSWRFSHYFKNRNARDIRDNKRLSQIPLRPFADQFHFADFIPHFSRVMPNLEATNDVSVIFDNLVEYTSKVKSLFYVVVKYFRPNISSKSYKNGWLLVDFGYTSQKPKKYRTVFDKIPDIENIQLSELEFSDEPVTLTSSVIFPQQQSHIMEPSSRDRNSHGMEIKLNRPEPRSLRCNNHVKGAISGIFSPSYVRIAFDFVNFLPGSSSDFNLENVAENLGYFKKYRIHLDPIFLSFGDKFVSIGNCSFLTPSPGVRYFDIDISKLGKQIKNVKFGVTDKASYIDFYY